MKKLYANGCSFTQGHKDHIVTRYQCPVKTDVTREAKGPAPWSWPMLFENDFDQVVNHGWCGGSNHRMFRRSTEFLSTVPDPENWTVIIQLTSLERTEWFHNKSSTWIGQLMNRVIYDDESWNKEGIDRDSVAKFADTNINAITLCGSDNYNIIELLNNVIAFNTYCKSIGVEQVLYTAMSSSADINMIANEVNRCRKTNSMPFWLCTKNDVNTIDALLSCIDLTTVLRTMSDVTKGYEESPTDGHPSVQGHEYFYKYVRTELLNRGII